MKRIVILGFLGLFIVFCAYEGINSARENQPADWNVNKAVAVAGLDEEQAYLYGRGIQHIRNTHGDLNGITIYDVWTSESDREANRADAKAKADEDRIALAQKKHNARVAANQDALEKDAGHRMRTTLDQVNEMTNQHLFTGYEVDGTVVTITVDGDIWETLSEQDKNLTKQTMDRAWYVNYNQAFHGNNFAHTGEHDDTSSRFVDEAGDNL